MAIRKIRLMTAVKTPYSDDGNIDLEAFDRHVEHQIENGVEALIIGGTTGEVCCFAALNLRALHFEHVSAVACFRLSVC